MALLESATVMLAALGLVGVTLLTVMNQGWFRRLSSPSRRRHHFRRRRRPRYRRAA